MGNVTSEEVQRTIIENKLQYDGTIASYNTAVSKLSDEDKRALGKLFDLYKISCNYKFLVSKQKDPDTESPQIISQYNQLKNSQQSPLETLIINLVDL